MPEADNTIQSQPGVRVMQIDVRSDGSAAATAYFPRAIGRLHSIRYAKHGTNPYADTVDFTITNETTGQGIWTQINQTASVTKFPRFLPDNLVGVALSALTVAEPVLLNNERIKVVLAQAGNEKDGSFEAVILPH
jgi:hypothetical protein